MSVQILPGDCLEVLKTLPSNSVDALVTDPPYGWRFMGKAWDGEDIEATLKRDKTLPDDDKTTAALAAGKYDSSLTANQSFQEWTRQWAAEALRVLKPGAHALIFCGPRTYHRMASGVEDAGFEIRDQIQWLFGSGFPKSLDISKAIDKAAGVEREVVGENPNHRTLKPVQTMCGAPHTGDGSITAPSTDAAKQWQGWGTALKPANEPILLARKPISEKTVAANVLKWGTGGLNIDACRIGSDVRTYSINGATKSGNFGNGANQPAHEREHSTVQGRFPANLILDEEAGAMLDEQSLAGGMHSAGKSRPRQKHVGDFGISEHGARERMADHRFDDGGHIGASRFFYCAKVSPSERNAGLEGMPNVEAGIGDDRPSGQSMSRLDGRAPRVVKNHHPTVKPIKLMRYLCKLVTPPGGTVLDPFCGSGSTGLAALEEGFQFLGIEREQDYIQIAEKRIFHKFPEFKKQVEG